MFLFQVIDNKYFVQAFGKKRITRQKLSGLVVEERELGQQFVKKALTVSIS